MLTPSLLSRSLGLALGLALAVGTAALAQPAHQWSYTYGGENYEEIQAVTLAPDSGFVAVGRTSSPVSGTVGVANSGLSDVVVVRMSPTGRKQWERVIGGSEVDEAFDVIVDTAGRIVVVGRSFSDADGTKTSPRVAPGPWASDGWLIVLDADGNDVWQRSFGGAGSEGFRDIELTTRGTYLLAGRTDSDASPGTQRLLPRRGGFDYWLAEVDTDGTFLREWVYGGAASDELWDMIRLRDGGFVVAGSSQSGVGFEKTRPPFGSSDMWLLELSADGAFVRDYQLGGSGPENPFFLTEFRDGDLFVSGQSLSPASGNKTTPAIGGLDLWCARFARGTGAVRWDRTLGGVEDDNAYTGRRNINDYIVLAGNTRSPVRGDSVDVIEGFDDGWLVYLSPQGDLIWDITRGGDERDNIRALIRSEDGGWYLGGESNSNPFEWRTPEAGGPFGLTDGQGVRANDGWLAKLECDFEVRLQAEKLDLCRGESVTLRNTEAVYLPHTTFEWSDGSFDSTLIVTPVADDTVTLASVSPDACESQDTIVLDVHDVPRIVDLDAVDETCPGRNDASLALAVDDVEAILLDGDPFPASGRRDSLSGGTYAIRLTSTLERCAVDTTLDLSGASAFGVDLGPDQEHVVGTTITLDPELSGSPDGLTYRWGGSVVGVCADCEQPTFRLMNSGTVMLTLTDANGCVQTAELMIVGTKDRTVGVPNAFSPNRDGVNDRFGVYLTPFVEQAGPLRIFDRWGNQVYVGIGEQMFQARGWDGTYRGRDAGVGVYTYVLPIRYIDGVEETLQGEINLLR